MLVSCGVKILNLYISVDHNYYGHFGKPAGENPIVEVSEIECVAGSGIKGDRFFDYKEDYKGQITLFDYATYERVMSEFALPDLQPSAFRRNVVVKGADLNKLIGKDFTLGVVELSGSEEAKPCYWMDEACAPGVEKFLRGSGGLRCRIKTGGSLTKGIQPLKII